MNNHCIGIRNVDSCFNYRSGYKNIYTTRLHGLILAALLGKETYFLDNSYGKVSAVYDTWLKDVDNVHPVSMTGQQKNAEKKLNV